MATTTRTQRLQARCDALLGRAQLMIDAATRETRGLSDAETAEHKALLDEHAKLLPQIASAESDDAAMATLQNLEFGGAPGMVRVTDPSRVPSAIGRRGHPSWPPITASIGEQFIRSQAYEYVQRTKGARPERWQSPSVELYWPTAGMMAATLSEDPSSGGTLVIPDYRPGVLPLTTRALALADLIAPGTTDSNLITYTAEKTYVNAADTVAEGAAKPESTLTFDTVSDPVRKIAHWLPATEEMLEDVSFIRSYLDARLRLGVQLAEDDQLLNGSLVAPDIVGIRNRAGLAAPVVRGATEPVVDAIWRQMMLIANTALVMPDGIVMNPIDYASVPLMKTSTGDYIGDGPFRQPGPAMLWGTPVAITPAMPAGVALVGAFRSAAQIFRRSGVRVDTSNSHQDCFVKNLVAIRAEERLALAVYRPAAFGEVTGLTLTP